MKASMHTATIVMALLLLLDLFFWYMHPALPVSRGELSVWAAAVGTLVLAAQWAWRKARETTMTLRGARAS